MQSVFAGLKAIDTATFVAAPAAAVILSDFGADVIKVEPLGGGRPVSPDAAAGDPRFAVMAQRRANAPELVRELDAAFTCAMRPNGRRTSMPRA